MIYQAVSNQYMLRFHTQCWSFNQINSHSNTIARVTIQALAAACGGTTVPTHLYDETWSAY